MIDFITNIFMGIVSLLSIAILMAGVALIFSVPFLVVGLLILALTGNWGVIDGIF